MTKSFYDLVPSAPEGRYDGIDRPYSVEEVERLRGDIKLIKQSIEVIETNHLVHLDKKVNKINNILWTVGLMIFAQLIITIKTLII